MKPPSKLAWVVLTAWLVLPASFVAAVLWLPATPSRDALGNVFFCLLPLCANGVLLSNATTSQWRKNAFWMLLALGSSIWLAGQFIWTYLAVYQHQASPNPFSADVLYFLHALPMIAALTLQPHKRHVESSAKFGQVDFGLIACWWIYLYAFVALPWQFAIADYAQYMQAYVIISGFENLIFVGGATLLAVQARGQWRRIYALLAGSRAFYTFGLIVFKIFVTTHTYTRVSLQSIPLIYTFLLLGTAGVCARGNDAEEKEGDVSALPPAAEVQSANENIWASRMARGALLSLPVIGFWSLKMNPAPPAVHEFRTLITLGAVLPLGFLALLRHQLLNADRLRLLRASQESLDNLKRLQMQFVQSEKLAAIGQLVGGVAHEINNPLTAILGYSELLSDDPTVDSRVRSLAEKIREQGRRTKSLVDNLLSFARQAPSDRRSPLDINSIVNTAVQFRRVDLRGKNIHIEVQTASHIPEVRADANQLLQVFCNIINNAVDAMNTVGGGTLTVRTQFEKGNAVIIFSDTGKGIRDPQLVFDPFYTTKPVGQGTGLGLSICYGLVHDQGGKISCQNRLEGGATFRVELPTVPTLFSQRADSFQSQDKPAKLA